MIYAPTSPLLHVSSQKEFVRASADINCPVVLEANVEAEEAEDIVQGIWNLGLQVEQNNWVIDVHGTPLGARFRYRNFDAVNARAQSRYYSGLPEEYEPAEDILRALSDSFRDITDIGDHQIFCIPRCSAFSDHTHDHPVITETYLNDLGTRIRNTNVRRGERLWIPVGESHASPNVGEDSRIVISATPTITL